jgi:hypothetical protein
MFFNKQNLRKRNEGSALKKIYFLKKNNLKSVHKTCFLNKQKKIIIFLG